MPKASELKKGMVVEIQGVPHIVKHLESKSPSSRGAVTLYKIEFRNLQNGSKVDSSLKGGDLLPLADFIRIPVQYSYSDSDNLYFMNSDTFEQFEIARDKLMSNFHSYLNNKKIFLPWCLENASLPSSCLSL